MNEFELPFILSGILSLITLIVFFIMSANVAKIRSILAERSSPKNDFNRYMFYGEHDKARESLKLRLWLEIQDINRMYDDVQFRLKAYDDIKKLYAEDFKALEMKFPKWSGSDNW